MESPELKENNTDECQELKENDTVQLNNIIFKDEYFSKNKKDINLEDNKMCEIVEKSDEEDWQTI